MSSVMQGEWLQTLDEVKTWSNKLRQLLLNHTTMTAEDQMVLKNYRKEFAWIHQILFSTHFEDNFFKNETKKTVLKIVK